MKSTRKTIIEQIYEGEWIPREHIQSRDPEYARTCQEAEEEYLYLQKLLNEAEQKHLDRLVDLHWSKNSMDSSACFSYGFQYGSLLMMDILTGEGSLCSCPQPRYRACSCVRCRLSSTAMERNASAT